MKLVMTTVLIAALTIPLAVSADDAPDFYIGIGYEWDLENNGEGLGLSFRGGGKSMIGPEIGVYNDKLLIGVAYMALGPRSKMKGIYGGPSVFYFDDNWGGGATLGTHLTREVILEASYLVGADWDGAVEVGVAYGLDWPWDW